MIWMLERLVLVQVFRQQCILRRLLRQKMQVAPPVHTAFNADLACQFFDHVRIVQGSGGKVDEGVAVLKHEHGRAAFFAKSTINFCR